MSTWPVSLTAEQFLESLRRLPRRAGARPRRPAAEESEAAGGPAVAAATLEGDRASSQKLRLSVLRELQVALGTGFAAIDKALPPTTAYAALARVRGNALADIGAGLDAADARLARADAAAHADDIQLQLERATLGLYLLPVYADLAALIRAAETDRLIPDVIIALAAEAGRYADVLGILAHPKLDAKGIAIIRGKAPGWLVDTRAKISKLAAAIKRGREAVAVLEKIERVLDVPIELLKGLELPPQVLFLDLVVDWSGFGLAHRSQIAELARGAPPFFAELGWLERNAPLTRRYILDPMFKAIGIEALKSLSAGDIAFILGRTIRNIMHAGGSLAWKLALKSLAKATIIVGFLDSPKLVAHGIGRLSERTAASVLGAVGGAADPYGVIAELNSKLEAKLSPEEAARLLLELTSPGVTEHLGYLATAGAIVGPNIAAVLADIEGTGVTTAATAAATLAFSPPLLPAAP